MKWRIFWGLLVFWPAVLWLAAFAAAMLTRAHGCTLSAAGPSPCIVFGADLGETLYPLWALGYLLPYVFFWIVPAGTLWLIVGFIRARL